MESGQKHFPESSDDRRDPKKNEIRKFSGKCGISQCVPILFIVASLLDAKLTGQCIEPLKLFERSKIADALEVETYQDGEKIVVEGDVRAEKFYIVEEVRLILFEHISISLILTNNYDLQGTVDIYKRDANTGKDVKINCAKRGVFCVKLRLDFTCEQSAKRVLLQEIILEN